MSVTALLHMGYFDVRQHLSGWMLIRFLDCLVTQAGICMMIDLDSQLRAHGTISLKFEVSASC